MKKTAIRAAAALTVLLLVSMVSGCFAANRQIELTEEEKWFIEKHPVIRIGIDPGRAPYELKNRNGQYEGLVADYVKLICEKTGLVMEAGNGASWSETYEKAVRKELDVLPCVAPTARRREDFLFSEPYCAFERALYVRDGNRTIRGFTDLAGVEVAVRKESSHAEYAQTVEDAVVHAYGSDYDALMALLGGKADAYIGHRETAEYIIRNDGLSGLKKVDTGVKSQQVICFAVRKDWPELVSIINKCIKAIPMEKRLEISRRWLNIEEDSNPFNLLIGIAALVVVIIIALTVSLFWISTLRKEIVLREKMQKELKKLKDEAEMANHFKTVFLSRMSHEIRTPLNAITGMTYLLTKTDITAAQRVYLDKITQSAKNMLGIINDILDFSKVESGKIDIERVSFNLDLILAQVVNLVSYQVEEKGIDFIIERAPELPAYFYGDPTRIQQVILNIVSNAIKFTSEGSVSVSVLCTEKTENTYGVEFRIKDTGIGMSTEQTHRIFVPFNQADSSIGRRFGGTGLGLTIAKNLTELMGGSIMLQSAEGIGSVFTVSLKLEEDNSQENRMKSADPSGKLSELRVLVIEKSPFYLNLIREYLNSFRISPEIAASDDIGKGMLINAETTDCPFDLMILDYMTPKAGGIAYFEELRKKLGRLPKCILLLPLGKDYLYENVKTADINYAISKPFLPSSLYNAIIETVGEAVGQRSEAMSADSDLIEDGANYHVLIVEDNKTNQYIAQALLTRVGIQVSLAADGREGYDMFSANRDKIHLVLMDLHMPVMDGFEATRLIKEVRPEVPVIALTADAITGIEEKCRECGIDRYISKPFDPDKFIGVVTAVLKKKRRNGKPAPSPLGGKPAENSDAARASAPIDRNDGLMRMGGDKKLYHMILGEFYKENLEVPDRLMSAIDAGDLQEAVRIVHKIKGSAGNIGAKGLFAAAVELQNSLKSECLSRIAASNLEFLREYDRVFADLKQILVSYSE